MTTLANGKQILIIDDEPMLAKNIATFVGSFGYKPALAHNGTDGLNIFEEKKYPVVLLDIKLPDINGLDILKRILEIQPWTSVVMVSGVKEISIVEEAMKRGAYDFISKPFVLELLLRRVHLAYLEYLAHFLHIDIEKEISQQVHQLLIKIESNKTFDPKDIEDTSRKLDKEINRELNIITDSLRKKFLA